LALSEGFLATGKAIDSVRSFALALLDQVVFAIELTFPFFDPSFLALDFFAPAADFDFPLLAKLHQLFFAGEDGRFAQAFCLALSFIDDSLGCLFGSRARLLLAPELGAPAQS